MTRPTDLSVGPIDIVSDSSQDVREDTAELASWALSDKPSFDNAYSPTRHSLSPIALCDDAARPNGRIPLDHGQAEDSSRPDVIPELSEPVSPSSMPSSRKSPGMSALSEMFKSTPSTDEGDPCANDEDESIGSSRLGVVTVQEGIISQPTEQTALLLREQAHRSNVKTRQSYIGDLENQKSNQSTTTERRFKKVVVATAGYSKSAFMKIIHPKSWKTKTVWDEALLKPAGYIPSVILGLLLNILDALSYGQYERPAAGDQLISL